MRDAGLAHLLSISGLHIAIVVGGTLWAVRRALTMVPWLALRLPVKALSAGAAAFAGITYTLLAGGEVPTVRSCIATLIVLVGVAIGREALTLRLVAAAAFLILLIRPESLLGPSFQLSFAAVTGIVALYQSRLGRWLAEPVHNQGWMVRVFRHLLMLLVTGLVAEAMLAATALYHFNRAGVYGVFANLIAIPWTSFVVMPLLIVALLAGALGIGAPFEWLLGKSMDLLIELARVVASWPGAVFRLPLMPDGAYLLLILGGLWLCIWQGRSRLLGILPLAMGGLVALLARPPDLLVSADGRHAAYLVPDGRLAFLRDRAGDYIRDMWSDATAATTADVALSELPGARCSIDACVADLDAGGRRWRLLATLSRDVVPREAMAPACGGADIVVSMRRLPAWCAPRWLKLDREALGETGAVAIWLDPPRVATVAARLGDHPWLPKPAPWHAKKRRSGAATVKAESWD
ncbi:ComEC/Rec2 family competence protein [Sphingosinicellaceae bacterium]|nr:ComEC/Rec2 family competence protein [Sphingosinicellaceae bacterium]